MSLLIALVAALLVSMIVFGQYERHWKDGLTISVAFGETHVTEGDSGRIDEVVVNQKRLLLPALQVKFPVDRAIVYKQIENTKISDKQYRNDCMIIMPYEKLTRSFEVQYKKRGYYRIEQIEAVASDFFFQTIFADRIANSTSIYVYPLRTKVKAAVPSLNGIVGEYVKQSFVYEDPFEFRGIRGYESTDPIKKINWAVSAKTGELMVNQYNDTTHAYITIYLDLESEGMLYYEELEEEAIRVTRTYLEGFIKNGMRVHVVTNACDCISGERIEFEGTMNKMNLQLALQKLARINTRTISFSFKEYFAKEKQEGLSVLISVSQSVDLKNAYEQFLLKGEFGEWMILIKNGWEKKLKSNRIHIVYGEVEQC